MKFSTKLCIAALATTAAFPVLAQRMPVGGSSTNKKAPDGALPQETANTRTETTGEPTRRRPASLPQFPRQS